MTGAPKCKLRIRLFGTLHIESSAGPIHLPAKIGSLLAYMLLHPGPLAREKLATLLWGDVLDDQARHSLRTALNHIRKELGDQSIEGDREVVGLNPSFPLWVDAWEFDRLCASLPERLSAELALVDLYRGDLLADLYDEWILFERDRYCERYKEALLQATQAARSQGEYARAVLLARHVLTQDPANERAHQHLMFCLAANGDRPAALRQYEECCRALRDELDVPPSHQTVALGDWIKRTSAQSVTREALVTNLPCLLTSFIGRKREIAQIKALLAGGQRSPGADGETMRSRPATGQRLRLLTLTGAGGSGKTRLAIEVGLDLVRSYRDGVWWIDLAPVAEGNLVPQTMARILGVSERPRVAIGDTLVEYLRPREMLVLLDNCEHLADACATLIAALLEGCPTLTILATSRVALGIAGERVFYVPTLPVPDPGEVPSLSALREFDAIELFMDRAAAASPGLALTGENARDVIRVCTQLDGIPLAIELAAALTKVLAVEQMAHRLVDRLCLPALGSAAVLPRHRTLRATIDWSYDLLTEPERALFQRLSAFVGGWSLEAAEQVCSGGSVHSEEVLELLTHLVDKSLVTVHTEGPESRYRQLESLRQYGAERLALSGEDGEMCRRHAMHFAALAERAESGLRSTEMTFWLQRLEADHDNLRAALGWSLDHERPETSLRFARALGTFWSKRGYLQEGSQWIARLVACSSGVAPEQRARAMVPAGWFARVLGDYERAIALNKEAVALCRLVGDKLGAAEALYQRGTVALYACDFRRAYASFDESLALAEQSGERWARAAPLLFLAHTAMFNLAWDAWARAYADEALALFAEMDDRSSAGHAHIVLGLGAHLERDDERALRHLEQAVRLCRQSGDQRQLAMSMGVLSLILHFLGRWPDALVPGGESLRMALRLGEKTVAAQAMLFLACLAMDQGQAERTARLMSYTYGWGASFGFRLAPMMHACFDPPLEEARARLGEAAFADAWAAGRVMSERQALLCALGS